MPSNVIVCPSGLQGDVRGLKVREANILADQTSAKKSTAFDDVLRGIWLETVDPGIYTAPLNFAKVLQCDRFVIMLESRILTYGPEYTFPVQCTEPGCRHRFEWEVDLSKLTRKELPVESRERFLEGNKFDTTLDGRRVSFKLLTGEDEARAAKLASKSRSQLISVSLATRIVEIEGVHPQDKLRWIEDLDMGGMKDLLARFEEVDGGVETTEEVECPSCLNIMDVELPFAREFYLPRARPRKEKATE